MIVDLFMVYQFLKRLAKPFTDWDAFKLGIIDKDGNILIKTKDFTTEAQRNAFGKFDLMILNLKKLIAKVPGGNTKIGTMAAVLYLIKEGTESEEINEDLFNLCVEDVGIGVPSTNTSNIPDSVQTGSPDFKRKKKQFLKKNILSEGDANV